MRTAGSVVVYEKRSRTRRIAHRIIEVRKYTTFVGNTPVYGTWGVSHIRPARRWRNAAWLHNHIAAPAIRERLRWPEYKFVRGVMPASLGLDVEDQILFELEETDE